MDLEKSIDELAVALDGIEILDEKAVEIVELSKAYASDAKHFLGENKEDALEAYAIAWAYLDALLHFDFIDVADKSLFTVDQ